MLSVAIIIAIWPWARQVRALVAIAVATAIGIVLWNLALNVTNASGLNVDSPLFGLSVQDVGSGAAAFVAVLLVLRFAIDRDGPVSRALGLSAVVGVATILVDLFA